MSQAAKKVQMKFLFLSEFGSFNYLQRLQQGLTCSLHQGLWHVLSRTKFQGFGIFHLQIRPYARLQTRTKFWADFHMSACRRVFQTPKDEVNLRHQ
jgi:hypothetical protein